MATTNTDFLPNTTGLNLGSPDQAWDGFFDNINAAGDVIVEGDIISNGGVTIATGNATKLQGNPIAPGLPLLNQALIWNGLAWAPANQSGSGGGASLGYVSVGYSATPVFTPSPVGSCAFSITLAGNVTSSTFTIDPLLTAGTLFTFIIRQDGSGGHTFVWPTECLGDGPIGTAVNQINTQSFLWDGTNLLATSFLMVY